MSTTPLDAATPTDSLDDQLKRAEIEKARAEALKTTNEALGLGKTSRSDAIVRAAQTICALIIGVGGVVAAVTQYELKEYRAEVAGKELAMAQKDTATEQKRLADAETAESKAQSDRADAETKRDNANAELREAKSSLEEVKKQLATRTAQVQTAKPDLLKARLVYIQFKGDITRERINDLRVSLQQFGYNTPGAERIDKPYTSRVKYFSPGDYEHAKQLAQKIETYFDSQACPLNLEVRPTPDVAKPDESPPLEVWLSHSCK